MSASRARRLTDSVTDDRTSLTAAEFFGEADAARDGHDLGFPASGILVPHSAHFRPARTSAYCRLKLSAFPFPTRGCARGAFPTACTRRRRGGHGCARSLREIRLSLSPLGRGRRQAGREAEPKRLWSINRDSHHGGDWLSGGLVTTAATGPPISSPRRRLALHHGGDWLSSFFPNAIRF